MKNVNIFKQIAAGAVLTASLGFASSQAMALADFTIDDNVYGGSAGLVVGDKLNGAYTEVISFDGLGGFAVTAFANFGQLQANDGTTDVAPANPGFGLNTNYGIYALFEATGTVSVTPGGFFQFNGMTAGFDLYADADFDTTFATGATAAAGVTLGMNGDDDLLASAASLSFGTGLLVPGVGGFFDLVFNDFTLSGPGGNFFVAPNPFHFIVNVDGDFDNFTASGNQTVVGDVSAVFRVPAPTSIALMGLGLSLLGFGARRRK